MIQELKTYICDQIPADADILNAIKIVQEGRFVMRLLWNVEYSGTYDVIVAHDSTLESVKAQMPTIYPV